MSEVMNVGVMNVGQSSETLDAQARNTFYQQHQNDREHQYGVHKRCLKCVHRIVPVTRNGL